MKKELDEDIKQTMKIAIVTSMMPPPIQDFVHTNIEKNAQY